MFTTSEGLFEPTVIFSRQTNPLTTFQTMMNEIIWDLINMGKMASFIDDVIIGIEGEEGYDQVGERGCKEVGRE